MTHPASLDPAWRGRALYFDLMALVVLVLSAVAGGVAIRSYLIDTSAGLDPGRRLVILGLAAAVFVLSYAWIAARLVLAGLRDATGGR